VRTVLDIVRRSVRRLPPLLLIAAAALAALPGCRDSGANAPDVVATSTQVADMTRAVAGDRVRVAQILRPGSDPHEYEPRPSDAEAVAHARVVIRSGGEVDGWLAGLLRQAGGGARVVTLADRVERSGDDPHWWQDPRNGVRAVEAIRAALTRADPQGAAGYEARAAAYARRLSDLDRQIAACVARLPERSRRLVTSHDALGYYARRYGLTVVGAAIPSLSTQAQPSARATERLVSRIRHQHVRAIFPESALNPKLERAIARDAGARVGGALWADALGPRGSSGATYAGSLAANTRTIVSGLSGGALTCAGLPR
jgi:zinc/manganese transport system substrate-binding protein